MRFALFVLVLAFVQGCGVRPENGTYALCREAFVFQHEILELRNGQFRYWGWSDIGLQTITAQGKYKIEGDRIVLETDAQIPKIRYRQKCYSWDVLMREDAKELWDNKQKLY